jgi:predicted acetyltransferase
LTNICVKIADATAKNYIEYSKLYIEFAKEMDNYSTSNYFRKTKMSLDNYRNYLENPNTPIYFLYVDDQVVGFASVIIEKNKVTNKNDFYISHFCINEISRSKGFGSIFFNELKSIAKKSNTSNITLINIKENTKALYFYQKHNMKPLDEYGEKLLLVI